jgi:MtN3 and saliva related transmembrane protein
MIEALGWASSIVLLATIVQQIVKQWREGSARGVSKWLFVGQASASLGFTIYSALLRNWVFTVTNGLLLLSAITGMVITFHFKRRSHGMSGAAARATP